MHFQETNGLDYVFALRQQSYENLVFGKVLISEDKFLRSNFSKIFSWHTNDPRKLFYQTSRIFCGPPSLTSPWAPVM
jgi:hypothetical protein